jgi:hypothetical protein
MSSKWKKAVGKVKATVSYLTPKAAHAYTRTHIYPFESVVVCSSCGTQNTAVEAFKSVPKGIDGDTFFAPVIPDEVHAAVPLLHTVDQTGFRRVLQASLEYLRMEGFGAKEMEALHSATGIEDATLGIIFTGCHAIVRAAVRNRTKLSVIEKDLKAMNVPDPIVADFVMVHYLDLGFLHDSSCCSVCVGYQRFALRARNCNAGAPSSVASLGRFDLASGCYYFHLQGDESFEANNTNANGPQRWFDEHNGSSTRAVSSTEIQCSICP